MTTNTKPLLEIQDLKTYFTTLEGEVRAVDGVSFTMAPQETWGLVGESGCGKSVTAYSVLRLLPLKYCRIAQGKISFQRSPTRWVDPAYIVRASRFVRSLA